MPPCDRCHEQAGRPGHFPPHHDLEPGPVLRDEGGQKVYTYRCRRCGQAMLLQAPSADLPDRWSFGGRTCRR